MPSRIDSTKELSSPPLPEIQTDLARKASWVEKAARTALYILAGAAILGAIGAACYVMAYPIAAALVGVAIALAVIGTVKAINSIAHKLPKALEKAIQVTHAVVSEILALVVVGLLYPLQALLKKKITKGAADERPILLVHGYLHNRSAWAYTMHRLKNAGFKSVYTINLWHPFRSIEHDYAKQIQEKLKEIAKETGRNDCILIGHSMGGDASSEAACTLDPSSGIKVTHVITLGSPLKGTPMAILGLGPNAREMETGSTFTTNLQKKIKANKKTQFFNVASAADAIVPGKYAHLDHLPDDHKLHVNDIGHLGMLYDPRIHDRMIEWLRVVPEIA